MFRSWSEIPGFNTASIVITIWMHPVFQQTLNKVLHTDDEQMLDYLNQILSEGSGSEIYQLSDFEKSIIAESKSDYMAGIIISNEDVFTRNEEWLNGNW